MVSHLQQLSFMCFGVQSIASVFIWLTSGAIFAAQHEVTAVYRTADGDMFVAEKETELGKAGLEPPSIIRHRKNGGPYLSFGNRGRLVLDVFRKHEDPMIHKIVEAPNGNLIIGGELQSLGGQGFIIQMKPNGEIVPNADGKQVTRIPVSRNERGPKGDQSVYFGTLAVDSKGNVWVGMTDRINQDTDRIMQTESGKRFQESKVVERAISVAKILPNGKWDGTVRIPVPEVHTFDSISVSANDTLHIVTTTVEDVTPFRFKFRDGTPRMAPMLTKDVRIAERAKSFHIVSPDGKFLYRITPTSIFSTDIIRFHLPSGKRDRTFSETVTFWAGLNNFPESGLARLLGSKMSPGNSPYFNSKGNLVIIGKVPARELRNVIIEALSSNGTREYRKSYPNVFQQHPNNNQCNILITKASEGSSE